MKQFRINAELLNGVKLAKGEKHPKWELNYIFVWDDAFKRNYMATNGHIMFLATDNRQTDEPLIEDVLAFDFKGTIKARTTEMPLLCLNDDGTASIYSTKENKPITMSKAKMPDGWDRVIPTKNNELLQVFCLFNGEYLRRIQQFMGGDAWERPYTLDNDGSSPVAWISNNKTAVIMPVRV